MKVVANGVELDVTHGLNVVAGVLEGQTLTITVSAGGQPLPGGWNVDRTSSIGRPVPEGFKGVTGNVPQVAGYYWYRIVSKHPQGTVKSFGDWKICLVDMENEFVHFIGEHSQPFFVDTQRTRRNAYLEKYVQFDPRPVTAEMQGERG